MPDLGRFLEFSVPAPDLAASLDYYLQLGFSEVRVNDIRPRGYTAVTDGQIVIGLHSLGLDEPALTFVRPDLGRHTLALADAGAEIEFQRLGDDQFNEAGLRTADGQLLLLLEAPTFSATDFDIALPLIGRCTELALGCTTTSETSNFFETAGFLGTQGDEDETVRLAAPGLSIALRPQARRGVTLCFEPSGDWRAKLEMRGISARPAGRDYLLTTPEGTRLLLVSAS
jgi:catechol 2,3-dioxygenase-like lactoylglutathione lyase family enzyme